MPKIELAAEVDELCAMVDDCLHMIDKLPSKAELAAANKIIAEQARVIAQCHAALKHAVALADANLVKRRTDECEQSYQMCIAAIAKAEGQS